MLCEPLQVLALKFGLHKLDLCERQDSWPCLAADVAFPGYRFLQALLATQPLTWPLAHTGILDSSCCFSQRTVA